ncbi:MAG: hypothetical protein PWP64_1375 [Candidatus Cloacimonadota bacterium]|nr:hypothetical protein [Candidatus Cloacimonadota bacterium]
MEQCEAGRHDIFLRGGRLSFHIQAMVDAHRVICEYEKSPTNLSQDQGKGQIQDIAKITGFNLHDTFQSWKNLHNPAAASN